MSPGMQTEQCAAVDQDSSKPYFSHIKKALKELNKSMSKSTPGLCYSYTYHTLYLQLICGSLLWSDLNMQISYGQLADSSTNMAPGQGNCCHERTLFISKSFFVRQYF